MIHAPVVVFATIPCVCCIIHLTCRVLSAAVLCREHIHDQTIVSVGITEQGDLDMDKMNGWLGTLLREKGVDIYRMKGVLAIKGQDQRFVFQGIHMLFDGQPMTPWGDEPRSNKMIFIGKDLDRAELTAGFMACMAQ